MAPSGNIKKALIDALKTISSDQDFLLAVINYVRTDEDRLYLLEYIRSGQTPTYEDILLLSLSIYEQRNPQ